jgi:hypothetical protein
VAGRDAEGGPRALACGGPRGTVGVADGLLPGLCVRLNIPRPASRPGTGGRSGCVTRTAASRRNSGRYTPGLCEVSRRGRLARGLARRLGAFATVRPAARRPGKAGHNGNQLQVAPIAGYSAGRGIIKQGADMTDDYRKDPEAVSRLTPEQYRVTQKNGTEPPFRNEYWDNKEPGIYVDVVPASRCSPRPPSSTATPAGRASPRRSSRATWSSAATSAC